MAMHGIVNGVVVGEVGDRSFELLVRHIRRMANRERALAADPLVASMHSERALALEAAYAYAQGVAEAHGTKLPDIEETR